MADANRSKKSCIQKLVLRFTYSGKILKFVPANGGSSSVG